VRGEGTRNVIHRAQCRDRSEVTGPDQSLQLLACGTLGGEVRKLRLKSDCKLNWDRVGTPWQTKWQDVSGG
jgi:hypothetical protein